MKRSLIIILVAALLSSCTQNFYMGRMPQVHFTYPNSNVTPLTKVRGQSATKVSLFMRPSVSSQVISQACSDALSKSSGADVLINVDSYFKITQIAMLPIYISRYIVDGTSAKQEVGKQKLN